MSVELRRKKMESGIVQQAENMLKARNKRHCGLCKPSVGLEYALFVAKL